MSMHHVALAAALEEVVAAFLDAVRGDADAARELEASVPVFFGGTPAVGDPQAAWHGARRHAEWFLLERHSPALRGAPSERLLGAVRDALGAAAPDAEAAAAHEVALQGWLTSAAGAFEVEAVQPGEGAWLRDVAGLAHFALLAPELSERLVAGDLLVGRLHPVGDGLHLASPAAAVFRGEEVLPALERDLARLRQGPGAKLLRLGQAELERMFFRAPSADAAAPAAPELRPDEAFAAGRAWLVEHGVERARAEALLARLAAAPPTPAQLAPGHGDALGEVLDELAFETGVDLALARVQLLAVARAWADGATASREGEAGAADPRPAAPRAGAPRATPSDEARARAVDEFAARRAAGGDAGAELAALREALGLDDDESDEDDAPAPDFPGVVGAMVHEFVWETSVTEGERAARELAPLAHLAAYAAPIGVFEELGGRDLVRFASFWVIERGVVRDAGAARALLGAVRRFGEWCRDAHEHDVTEALLPALDGLEASLPRVVEANALVGGSSAPEVGAVYEVLDDAAARLRDGAGEEVALEIEPRLRARLAAGDRLRGRVAAGVLEVLRVYPPEAALGL